MGAGEHSNSVAEELMSMVLAIRSIIRFHRDQIGDDRCFLDDYSVWEQCLDSPPPAFKMEDGMKQCVLFYENRRAETKDEIPIDAIIDPTKWDLDLHNNSMRELTDKLAVLFDIIEKHRDITGRPRTVDDDRKLYAVLPEKLPADFRLPKREDFLGEARAPYAGCPSFWRSHANCSAKSHNLHKWGPCK
jgi:hypothetical protein